MTGSTTIIMTTYSDPNCKERQEDDALHMYRSVSTPNESQEFWLRCSSIHMGNFLCLYRCLIIYSTVSTVMLVLSASRMTTSTIEQPVQSLISRGKYQSGGQTSKLGTGKPPCGFWAGSVFLIPMTTKRGAPAR